MKQAYVLLAVHRAISQKSKNNVYQIHSNNIQQHAVVRNSDLLSAQVRISHLAVRE
jgi:hypothetical protein